MSTKRLLTVVLVILIGIFAVVAIDATQQSPVEEMADDFGNITQNIGDQIEDAS